MIKPSPARKADLLAARKAFGKSKEPIGLEDMASLWGVSKARFINVRSTMRSFPEPIGKVGNAIIYDSVAALDALIQYEQRHDKGAALRSSKVAKILGTAQADEAGDDLLPPSEMIALARVGAELERRKRDQRELVPFADVQQIAAQIFGAISARLSKLSDSADPNGRLPPATRASLDQMGKDLLLQIYEKLGDMLADDVDRDPGRAAKARKRPDPVGRTRVRRQRA